MHGPSLVVDPRAYRWRHAGLARPSVARDGALRAACRRLSAASPACRRALPRLAALGVTAIELMPINDFPGTRNWGYDGVLPFAPDRAYGTPDELKALVDAAHELGLMMFLDVVYNHFGPDGNYLGAYAPDFFRDDVAHALGRRDRLPPARGAALLHRERALLAARSTASTGCASTPCTPSPRPTGSTRWRPRSAARVEPGRHVHLVLEHDGNEADHLRRDFDAQWNDDAHHVLHVAADRRERRLLRRLRRRAGASSWRAASPKASSTRASPRPIARASRAARRAHDLPPTAFVLFLQNHDQIGNRAVRRPPDRRSPIPTRSRPRSRCSCSARRSR